VSSTRKESTPTLGISEAVERIQAGCSPGTALAEFADAFDLASSDESRCAMLEKAPRLTQDTRLDALVRAIGEYLAKQYKLDRIPTWVAGSARSLDRPWHTSSIFIDGKREFLTDGTREYLTFSSPAEFASRNIFTEQCPLRSARSEPS
jgi:hypothetical protein